MELAHASRLYPVLIPLSILLIAHAKVATTVKTASTPILAPTNAYHIPAKTEVLASVLQTNPRMVPWINTPARAPMGSSVRIVLLVI